jgi:predicted transcriptional regulator YdeE
MLIGYITKTGTTQTDPTITTIQIPAQDYRYTTTNDISPENIFGTWNSINTMSRSELPRSYGYDLDMYNENHTELTIAVSVSE